MAAVGGSIHSVTLNGRNFAVAADADAQRKLGGYENDVQANGNGTARITKTRVPWSLSGLTIEVDDSRKDHEFLQQLADRDDEFPCAVRLASGEVYQGSGAITGELAAGTQNATTSLALMGSGQLTRQ